jgi:hypothetical protein
MTNKHLLLCDGCGQPASAEHTTKRLQRLEWTTRYRPLHIATVLLGAWAPKHDAEFLYAEGQAFEGEAKYVLAATGVASARRPWQVVLTEFQRAAFLLTYALECPPESSVGDDEAATRALLESRLPVLLARIRRSLRPKRVVPISSTLDSLLRSMTEAELGCARLLDDGKAFGLNSDRAEEAVTRLRQALTAPATTTR